MCAVILCHLSDLINTGHSGIFMACQKNNRLRHFILILLNNNYKAGLTTDAGYGGQKRQEL